MSKEKRYKKGPKGEMSRIDDMIAEETPGTERYGKLVEQGTMVATYKDAKERNFWVTAIDIAKGFIVPITLASVAAWLENGGTMITRNSAFKMIPKGGNTELKRRDIFGGFKKK